MLYAVEALPQFKTKTERNSRSFFFFHLFARADPVVMVLVAGVEYGCVYNVMWELFEGIYFNIVVTYFVASVMLSLFINYFNCT